MVGTKWKLNHATFALNKEDPEELARAMKEMIDQTVDTAFAGMTREGYTVTVPPALTLVSHNGALFGVLLTWGAK